MYVQISMMLQQSCVHVGTVMVLNVKKSEENNDCDSDSPDKILYLKWTLGFSQESVVDFWVWFLHLDVVKMSRFLMPIRSSSCKCS